MISAVGCRYLAGVFLPIIPDLAHAPVLVLLRIAVLFSCTSALSLSAFANGGGSTANSDTEADGQVQTLDAVQLEDAIRIDGNLEEALYDGPSSSVQFTQIAPQPGAPSKHATRVWIAYDESAVYVAAKLYDHPDSILTQISSRDNTGNADWFGVSLSPYRDGLNATNFVVTAAGGQVDGIFTGSQRSTDIHRGDRSWDAVWSSASAKTEDGWNVEMRIPFSMLRFPKGATQYWDINFERSIARSNERSFWNPVDPAIDGSASQMGRLRGLRGMEPGLRLQLTPFVAASASGATDPVNSPVLPTGSSIQGGASVGMDLKYGINEAFTLDMTLVPDFSNARSDDQILNLGPNEQRFGESRTFFVEGTELFEKGGWFYSRRVGGNLFGSEDYAKISSDETAAALPNRARLLNATKVTGRTRGGLGIGAFNAIEGGERVTVTAADGSTRTVEAHPLTNYSVVSLDQNLPNSSTVTLINTNVLRSGEAYDANLTGLVWDLRDRSNTFGVRGRAGLSQQYGVPQRSSEQSSQGNTIRDDIFGQTANISAGKVAGRLTYGAEYSLETDTYNANDLGFVRNNNEQSFGLRAAYNWFKPVGPFNSANVNLGVRHGRLWAPNVPTWTGVFFGSRMRTRNFWGARLGGWSSLGASTDYNDARTPGQRINQDAYSELNFNLNTDWRQPLALAFDGRLGQAWAGGERRRVGFRVTPRWRVSDQLTVRLGGNADARLGQRGYVGHTPGAVEALNLEAAGTNYQIVNTSALGFEELGPSAILIGDRAVRSVELEGSVGYNLGPNANVNLRARHYWSEVDYDEFHELSLAGDPLATPYQGIDDSGAPLHDRTFNAFNVDCFVRWRFAPGSDAFLSYKTNAAYDGDAGSNYLDNLSALGDDAISNSLSVKVVYWLDAGGLLKRKPSQQTPSDAIDDLPQPGEEPIMTL